MMLLIEYPPNQGEKFSKLLGRNIGCKDKPLYGIKTGSPMVVTLDQQYNVGEKPTVYCTLTLIANPVHQNRGVTAHKEP